MVYLFYFIRTQRQPQGELMGLLKGAVTVSRFAVEGQLPADFWEWAHKRISANAFMDIEDLAQEKSLGWVSAHDYFDINFAYENYKLNPYLLLGIRQDKRTLSASLLRKYHRLEIMKARSLSPNTRLGRPEREMLKQKARLELLSRLPAPSTVWEMCWNIRVNELWFTTSNRVLLELSQELFLRSFAPLTLAPQIPFVLASRLLATERRGALESLTPLIS